MPSEERDPAYLWDMLDAARTVREFTADVSPEDFLKDRKLQLGVERAIQIIGEAARKVSGHTKGANPEIPWQAMIGQRNVLAHEYGRIDHKKLWTTATTDIPDLVRMLEPLIPPLPPDPE